jgi:iron complex transport system substrate-binding protein
MMKQVKRILYMFFAVMVILSASSCGHTPVSVSSQKQEGYMVVDDKGNSITLKKKPDKILTLALATDEMVLKIISPSQMVAVSSLAIDPGISTVAEEASEVHGRMDEYNAETILSYQPDLVIAPEWTSDDLIQTLKNLGLTVYISRGSLSVKDTEKAMEEISAVLGEEEKGKIVIELMNEDLQRAENRRSHITDENRKKVVLYSHLKGYEGKESLFDDLCSYAGVINGAASIGLGKNDLLSKESIVKINPDVILIPTWSHGDISPESVIRELTEDPALSTVNAIKNNNLKQVKDSYIFSASPDMTKAILGIQEAVYGVQ